MNQAIIFAALTVCATALGGLIALRSRDRFHLVLGLSAGLLLGLVGFDLLPEVFDLNTDKFGGVRAVSIAMVLGFLTLHILERIFGSHEPAESDYGHDHDHHHVTGTIGAIAMAGHIFLDGLGIGVAFQVSTKDGVARIGGAALGTSLVLSQPLLALYLALFSGFVIYIATSHILPEAHSRHESRWTLVATGCGVLAMWLVIAVA